MSENILVTSYKTLEEATKTSNQIRRASLIVQESEGLWKLLIINNRFNLENDLNDMDLAEADGFININDSQGKILRNRVQLNKPDLAYFTKIVGNFSGQDNPLTNDFGDASRRFKALLTAVKATEEAPKQEVEDRSGVYELRPMEFNCYFKSFRPLKILLQQELDEESYTSLILQLTFNDRKAVDTIAPLLRKAEIDVSQVIQAVTQGKSIQIVIELKEKVLEKMKYIMFANEDLESILNMRNPLGKHIFTDLSNYFLKDIKII